MSLAPRPTSNRVFNRQSVQQAIKSAQERLKLYNKCPAKGLVVYSGLATTNESNGKERHVSLHFEPPRPIKTFLYRCDNRFHTDNLSTLLVDEREEPYGFIVIDGNGTLFGYVQGTTREILHRFSVDLPNKHRRGGQSALRFDRIRMEKRNNYVRRVAELSTRFFITEDRPWIKGIVLAGSGDFKHDLVKSSVFDKRLRKIVLTTIDTCSGGESGFDQAITSSMDTIGSVPLARERRLLEQFMTEVERDTGRCCFSINQTLQALEMGAVEDLLIFENIALNRYELRDPDTGESTTSYLTEEQERNGREAKFVSETGVRLEVTKKERLVDWICDHYKSFGCNLEFVSDRSGLGKQFVLGFGGFGGLLRWSVDFASMDAYEESSQFDKEEDNRTSSVETDNARHEEYGLDDGDFGF